MDQRNVRAETIKLLGINLCDLGLGILDMTAKAQQQKEKMTNWTSPK